MARRRRITMVGGGRSRSMVRRMHSPKGGNFKKRRSFWGSPIFNLNWLFGGGKSWRH